MRMPFGRRGAARLAMLALLGLGAGACSSDELTEVVIIVEGSPQLQSRAQETTLVVTSDPDGTAIVHDGAPREAKFPYVIALSPRDGNEGSYRVVVTALAQGRPLAVARLISDYVPNQRRYVRLVLDDSCADPLMCSMDESCVRGRCVDAHVDEGSFGDDRDNAPPSFDVDGGDAAPANDAGGADAGGSRDTGAGAPDTGAPDTGAPDAGPPDAGDDPDTGAPPPDAGTPLVCAPQGDWTLTYTEQSTDCPLSLMQFMLPVRFSGSLTDYVSPECVSEIDLSSDGCELIYEADCLNTDMTSGETQLTTETGVLTMIAPDLITGTIDIAFELEDEETCSSTGSVIGTP